MKMLKQVGLMAVLLLLVSGCGTSEQEQSGKAETQSSSMKDGVKHVEAQKVKEQQDSDSVQQDVAAEVSAADESASAASSSAEEDTAATKEQKQRPEVQSGDEPTPERTSIHTIVMQNKYGKVAFNHAAHTQFISCSTCHSTEPPSRIELSRKEFHAICRTCHHEMDAGPVKCSGCHEH